MALSESELTLRIFALRRARDSGVLFVRHGDETTHFRTLAELMLILADLERELAGLLGPAKPRVNYISQSDKGY